MSGNKENETAMNETEANRSGAVLEKIVTEDSKAAAALEKGATRPFEEAPTAQSCAAKSSTEILDSTNTESASRTVPGTERETKDSEEKKEPNSGEKRSGGPELEQGEEATKVATANDGIGSAGEGHEDTSQKKAPSNSGKEKRPREEQSLDEAEPSCAPNSAASNVASSAPSAAAVTTAPRPVKRARTAYFIFADERRASVQKEHPGEGVAPVARALGQIWAAMSPEEKAGYQQKAAEERERVAKDIEAWKAAHGDAAEALLQGDKPKKSSGDGGLTFPMAKIRKICKLDPDVRGLSKEALLLVTKAAEMATARLGEETVRVAQIQNRRKILPEDVAQVCSTREQFLFLRDDIQDLARKQVNEKASTGKGDSSDNKSAQTAVPTDKNGKPLGRPLTDFFLARPKNG